MGHFHRGDHRGLLISYTVPAGRKTQCFLSSRSWVGRSGSWTTKPGMEEQEGPVWCLNTPEAGLGESSRWVDIYWKSIAQWALLGC